MAVCFKMRLKWGRFGIIRKGERGWGQYENEKGRKMVQVGGGYGMISYCILKQAGWQRSVSKERERVKVWVGGQRGDGLHAGTSEGAFLLLLLPVVMLRPIRKERTHCSNIIGTLSKGTKDILDRLLYFREKSPKIILPTLNISPRQLFNCCSTIVAVQLLQTMRPGEFSAI